jgi:hypothetical protein
MLAPSFVSLGIKVLSHNGGAYLLGNEVHQSIGRPLVLTQRSTGIAKKTHLYGNTKAIVVAAMLSHKSEIRLRQRIPANQLSGVIRVLCGRAALGTCGGDPHPLRVSGLFCRARSVSLESLAVRTLLDGNRPAQRTFR